MSHRFLTSMLLCAVLTSAYTVSAQSKSAPKAAAKSAADKYKRLPTYFGQLDLDEDQKQAVFKVRSEIGPKIDSLEEEIAKLKEEMNAGCEKVLTTAQKKTLAELQDKSKKPEAATEAKPKAAAKTATKSTNKKSEE